MNLGKFIYCLTPGINLETDPIMIYSLDIETTHVNKADVEYAALQPWRARQNKSMINSISIANPMGYADRLERDESDTPEQWAKDIEEFLKPLDECIVYCHNAPFDIAYLISTLTYPNRYEPIPKVIRKIYWRDTALLAKWIHNGQNAELSKMSYALSHLVEKYFTGDPTNVWYKRAQEFIEMKRKGHDIAPGEDDSYWSARGDEDAIFTRLLACKLISNLDRDMLNGYIIEQNCLVPVANAWQNGVLIDRQALNNAKLYYEKQLIENCKIADVTPAQIGSPKQLSALLYGQYGFKIVERTPTGAPSTSADVLKRLDFEQSYNPNIKKLKHILEAKTAKTILSKYVSAMYEALEHTGDGYMYPIPKLFGTYTGRMTYGSQTKNRKYRVSIAAHQIPRKDKEIRKTLIAPGRFVVYEADASGQESRLMAIASADETMINIFNNDINFHSVTGANIIGMDYEEFMNQLKAEGVDGGPITEARQLGKLTNLSCNYRIGGAALAYKALADYDRPMEVAEGTHLVKVFNETYSGIPKYWSTAVRDSKARGFTVSLSGRRYKLSRWVGRDSWMTESSAINFPIQGSGADMKEIAIATLYHEIKDDFMFVLDMHDATFGFIDKKWIEGPDIITDILNNIDYDSLWKVNLPIKLLYESKSGKSWSEVK